MSVVSKKCINPIPCRWVSHAYLWSSAARQPSQLVLLLGPSVLFLARPSTQLLLIFSPFPLVYPVAGPGRLIDSCCMCTILSKAKMHCIAVKALV